MLRVEPMIPRLILVNGQVYLSKIPSCKRLGLVRHSDTNTFILNYLDEDLILAQRSEFFVAAFSLSRFEAVLTILWALPRQHLLLPSSPCPKYKCYSISYFQRVFYIV